MTIAVKKNEEKSVSEVVENLKSIIGAFKALLLGQNVGLNGILEISHIRNGEIIDSRVLKNVIVNTGKAEVAGLINGETSGAFTYIAIGTGTNAADATDTTLQTEITTGGGERGSGTPSRVTTTVTNDTAQLVITYNFTSSFAVTESGIFDDPSSGIMLARRVFSAMNVANGDAIQITWKVQVSAT